MDGLLGSHKIQYRPTEDWDFEAGTDFAPIDVSLIMPPHRPKNQPENHRSSMFLSSDRGEMKVKVARHCLNRAFILEVIGATSDVTVWVPSNFSGYINYRSSRKAIYSYGFANHVLANSFVNNAVPKDWQGDEISITTAGTITFRMWDVFTKAPEVPRKEVWKKVNMNLFGGKERRLVNTTTVDWDFLLEDDDDY